MNFRVWLKMNCDAIVLGFIYSRDDMHLKIFKREKLLNMLVGLVCNIVLLSTPGSLPLEKLGKKMVKVLGTVLPSLLLPLF